MTLLGLTEAGEPFVPLHLTLPITAHRLQTPELWVLCMKMFTKSVYGVGEGVYQYLILESNFKVGLLS